MGSDAAILLPVHAREFVQELLDHKIQFDYIDIFSDRTVRVGRYPDGYRLPEPVVSNEAAGGNRANSDLVARWKGRSR